MFIASIKRQRTRRVTENASKSYAALEARQMLTFALLPEMTTDVPEFAQTVDNAIVRVDDQQRLIIRTTGDANRIDVQLEQNFLQVNRANYSTLALEIDPTQYDQIVLLSGGQDVVRVSGENLRAQLHPDQLWVSAPIEGASSNLQIHGRDFERVEVNDDHRQDVGPFIHRSNNRIRMYGSDGIDRLNMTSSNDFAIATNASLTGDGYALSSNVFGDLYVTGAGGDDFASLVGTRGFSPKAFLLSDSPTGNDVYFGRDNHSRISNDFWDGRFVDFETQRIDLLSGQDRGIVMDSQRSGAYYRVDGEQLVGAFRRMIGIETIAVDGTETSIDSLVRPDSTLGQFADADTQYVYQFDAAQNSENRSVAFVVPPEGFPIFGGGVAREIVPANFYWKFSLFERLVG